MSVVVAVITGALAVGTTIRHTLLKRVNLHLGSCEYAIAPSDRIFSAYLADRIAEKCKCETAPMFISQGTATVPQNNHYISRVNIIGINSSFDRFSSGTDKNYNLKFLNSLSTEAVINRRFAEKMNLKPGDDFIIRIAKSALISDVPLSGDKNNIVSF